MYRCNLSLKGKNVKSRNDEEKDSVLRWLEDLQQFEMARVKPG